MKILLPIDGSPESWEVLLWSIRFLDPAQSQLILLTVVACREESSLQPWQIHQAVTILQEAIAFLKDAGFSKVESRYLLGAPAELICHVANEEGVDQILMGTSGHSAFRSLPSQTSAAVIQHARPPVLLLRQASRQEKIPRLTITHPEQVHLSPHPPGEEPLRVLLPVDGSFGAQQALIWAAEFLNPARTLVHLIHVYRGALEGGYHYPEVEDAERILLDATRFLESRYFRCIETEAVEGDPVTMTCDYALTNEIQFIILASRSDAEKRGPFATLGASLARGMRRRFKQQLLQESPVPVILLNLGRHVHGVHQGPDWGEHASLEVSRPGELNLHAEP